MARDGGDGFRQEDLSVSWEENRTLFDRLQYIDYIHPVRVVCSPFQPSIPGLTSSPCLLVLRSKMNAAVTQL